jgi:hypothetical protein
MVPMQDRGHTDSAYRTYVPRIEVIRHYHGDIMRQLFLAAAAAMFLGAPFYSSAPLVQIPLIVIGALALVALAAFTAPHAPRVMTANVIFSGALIILYEAWALLALNERALLDFVLRELPAVLLLFAFYFAGKTLRAMLTGQIGREPAPHEFDTPEPLVREDENDFEPEPRSVISRVLAPRRKFRPRGKISRDALGNPAAPPLDKLD